MQCPIHKVELIESSTRFGPRHGCPEPDCTVVCWNGATSTPADAETRALRHQCHLEFDRLWQDRKIFATRTNAYRWLRVVMGLNRKTGHIGMLEKDQCLTLLAAVAELEPDQVCCICGRPAGTNYDDREDAPSCGRAECEIRMQAAIDYHDEIGNR